MDSLLFDIPKVMRRLDDILVAGTDEEDHLRTLSLILERRLSAGFRLNKNKCKFLQSSVVYIMITHCLSSFHVMLHLMGLELFCLIKSMGNFDLWPLLLVP